MQAGQEGNTCAARMGWLLVSRVKELAKWLIERDADAGGTVLGGKVDSVKTFVATVVGVTSGISAGFALFVGVYVIKWVAGAVDLRLRITEHRNNYLSKKVPMHVRIIKKEKVISAS